MAEVKKVNFMLIIAFAVHGFGTFLHHGEPTAHNR